MELYPWTTNTGRKGIVCIIFDLNLFVVYNKNLGNTPMNIGQIVKHKNAP